MCHNEECTLRYDKGTLRYDKGTPRYDKWMFRYDKCRLRYDKCTVRYEKWTLRRDGGRKQGCRATRGTERWRARGPMCPAGHRTATNRTPSRTLRCLT